MRLIGLAVLGLTTVSLAGARKWGKDKSVELRTVRESAQLQHFKRGNYHNDLQGILDESEIVDNGAVEDAALHRRKNPDQVHETSKWGYMKLGRLGRKHRDGWNVHNSRGDSSDIANFDEDRDERYEVNAGKRVKRRWHGAESLKSQLSDDGDEGIRDVNSAYELRDGTLYQVKDLQQDAERPRNIRKNSHEKPLKMLNITKPRRIIDYADDEYLEKGIAKKYPSNLGSNAGFFPRRNRTRRRNQFGAGNIGNNMHGATAAVKADDAVKWEDLPKPLVHSHKFGKLDYIP